MVALKKLKLKLQWLTRMILRFKLRQRNRYYNIAERCQLRRCKDDCAKTGRYMSMNPEVYKRIKGWF